MALNYKFLCDCRWFFFSPSISRTTFEYNSTVNRLLAAGDNIHPLSEQDIHLIYQLTLCFICLCTKRVSREGYIQQKTKNREEERACVSLCVPDKEHADPQSWLQSSPDQSVLRRTAMCPRAGSAEAAPGKEAEPPRQKRWPTNKRWSSAAADQSFCPAPSFYETLNPTV